MGTKICHETYLPGCQYLSERNTKQIPTSGNWSLFFGNKTIQNRQNWNSIFPGSVSNLLSGYEKNELKQMMLMHEAAFKNQVSELHRLYKVQKEIMSEIKRKELYKHYLPIETPPTSSSLFPKIDYNEGEVLDLRPSKTRKRLFDLHLPADNYIDLEDMNSDILSNSCPRNNKSEKLDSKVQFFDLNEPFLDDDVATISATELSKKNNDGNEEIIHMNGTGLDSNLGVNTTFPKLLSDEILKANGSPIKIGEKIRLIDINLVYEVDAEISYEENEKSFGGHIDLNMSVSEDEITLLPSSDESDTLAAMAIVAMSSLAEISEDPSEGSLEEALLWFSEAISRSNFENDSDIYTDKHTQAYTYNLSDMMHDIYSLSPQHHIQEPMAQICARTYTKNASDEIDEFEAMTLRLTELEKDEYMPSPLVFENMELEKETETIHLPIRARRGKAKGQKRDFKREILLGMTSLSRYEVVEDVQAFSGIMKAMGSSWPVLAKRRGSGGRGRPRLVKPKVTFKPLIERIDSVEIGWGKAPRRPRRRRCHTSTLSSIASL